MCSMRISESCWNLELAASRFILWLKGLPWSDLIALTIQIDSAVSFAFCKAEDSQQLYSDPVTALGEADMVILSRTAPFLLWVSLFFLVENGLQQRCQSEKDISIYCLLRWIWSTFAWGNPFEKQGSADDYNVCITLKLLICGSNTLGF